MADSADPASPKPDSCIGCPLYSLGSGWVPAGGPPPAPGAPRILFVGEAPGAREAAEGVGFVGDSGAELNRVLAVIGKDFRTIRRHNTLSCRPPGNFLVGAKYEHAALSHCTPNLERTLAEGWDVVVTLGATPLRRLVGAGATIEDFHGSPFRDPQDRFWIVATYHPSYVMVHAKNLTSVLSWDLRRAFDVAEHGWTPDEPKLICDPDPEWFRAWVDDYLAALGRGESVWLAADIETIDKRTRGAEDQLGSKDQTYEILRINFAISTDEGLTVPWSPEYLPAIRDALGSSGPKVWWNMRYDLKRLWHAQVKVAGLQIDGMDAWHVLQSDVPRSLGFVAPYYSQAAPWKHTALDSPIEYAAKDAVQTLRLMFGIAADLESTGMAQAFWRDVCALDNEALLDSERVGVLVNEPELDVLKVRLHDESERLRGDLIAGASPDAGRVHPKAGWARDPGTEKLIRWHEAGGEREAVLAVFAEIEQQDVKSCKTCGVVGGITSKHRCKEKGPKGGLRASKLLVPQVVVESVAAPRWRVRLPFNPGSRQQVLGQILRWGLRPDIDRDTKNPVVDKLCLDRLARTAPEEVRGWFRDLKLYKEIKKVESVYVDGTKRRLLQDRTMGVTTGRLTPTVTHRPSSMRTSYTQPNLQNVVADRGGAESLSAGFRHCIIAEPGAWLVEIDYAAIEAVITGYCARDPTYIRLAKLGVHAHLTGHLVGQPADLHWSDADLTAHFRMLKKKFDEAYNKAKRVVHGTNYGLTPQGMAERFPTTFRDVADAARVQALYFELAPKLKEFQRAVVEEAGTKFFVGGPGKHPFGYKHWFWDITRYRRLGTNAARARELRGAPVLWINETAYELQGGDDQNRAKSFYGQSIAAGIIRNATRRLFTRSEPNYIGGCFRDGLTPLRAIIHDSLFLEPVDAQRDRMILQACAEMTRPVKELPLPAAWGMGEYLAIGVSVKAGRTWAEMQEIELGALGEPAALLPVDDRIIELDEGDVEEKAVWDAEAGWGDDGEVVEGGAVQP